MKPFPIVTAEFIAALEERFPDRVPRKLATAEDIRRHIGHQEVLDFLRAQHSQQNDPRRNRA
jgi:hypothetical protein